MKVELTPEELDLVIEALRFVSHEIGDDGDLALAERLESIKRGGPGAPAIFDELDRVEGGPTPLPALARERQGRARGGDGGMRLVAVSLANGSRLVLELEVDAEGEEWREVYPLLFEAQRVKITAATDGNGRQRIDGAAGDREG